MARPCRRIPHARVGATGLLVLLGALIAFPASPAYAQQAGPSVVVRTPVGEDLYAAGGSVEVLAEVQGDVLAAGGRVSLQAPVRGDVAAAGGTVSVSGPVGDDVRAVGGLVTVAAPVGGDLVAAGGRVRLAPEAAVAGRAWLAGGSVEIAGTVTGHVEAVGRTVRISGRVDGDVTVAAAEVEVPAGARIGGQLLYRSPEPARIDPGAQIAGGVTHRRMDVPRPAAVARRLALAAGLVAAAGLALAALVLVLLFPRTAVRAARTIGTDPWKSLGVGFALLVAVPAAGVALAATVIGIPLGLALLALYAVGLLAGFLTGIVFLGDLALRPLSRDPGATVRVLSVILAVAVLALLQWVPGLGAGLAWLAVVLGLGALGVSGYRAYAGSAEAS
jgi:cytoskeletal protein CcmA (bactofilin family)